MSHDPLQRTKNRLEKLEQKIYKNAAPTIFGQKYFWVYGWTKGGKTVVLGPFYDAKEADRELVMLDDGEVFDLDTRDVTRATRVIKAELIARGGDPDEALKRVLHQKGVERADRKEVK